MCTVEYRSRELRGSGKERTNGRAFLPPAITQTVTIFLQCPRIPNSDPMSTHVVGCGFTCFFHTQVQVHPGKGRLLKIALTSKGRPVAYYGQRPSASDALAFEASFLRP